MRTCSGKDCDNKHYAKGLCAKHYQRQKRQDPEIRAKERVTQLAYYYKLKQEVFIAYGGLVCACCGEKEEDFLTLDHINNDGAAHRKELGSNTRVLQVLRQKGFPAGYQVLCSNCNMSKGKRGRCIHNVP